MRCGRCLLGVIFCGGALWAQSVISAHSGVVHYVEGEVTIDGTGIHPRFAEFPDLKDGQVLAAEEGRVEVLLTPGVFLRLAENSSVRMISNSLTDTRMEVVSGSALVEAGELLPNNAVTFETHGVRIGIPKKGLYRIDAGGARLQVYDGQAIVSSASENITAKKGHEIALDGATLTDEKFDVKATDPFYRWSARRAEYIAAANITAARVESNSKYRSGYAGGGASTWNWNPWFGMFTFVPASGIYWSPFGSPFYSPRVVTGIYVPRRQVWAGPQLGGMHPSFGGSGMPGSPSSAPPALGNVSGNMGGAGGAHAGGGFPGGTGMHPSAPSVGARPSGL